MERVEIGPEEMLCTVFGIVLGVLVALYALFELHYFLRMCLCVIAARYVKKRIHILETTTVTGEFGLLLFLCVLKED